MQGQICDILRPQLAMNCFLLLWPHRFSHFECINLGGGGVGGSDIRSMSSIRPICKCRCPPLPQIHDKAGPDPIYTVRRKWRSQDKDGSRSRWTGIAVCQDRRQKELLHSASSRAMEQPAKQPQSRKKAGVIQEGTQSIENKQLEDKENVSQERSQVWK